ncbi:hypothetical protein E2542_SST00788 [Spatholobus suberectus]|nr:hypothetical protein E2542_SST00788 [Spatholobus suberectus]
MASASCRIALRIVTAVSVLFFLFYFGRPVYWAISASIRDNQTATVTQGLSHVFIMEAQKSVGWYNRATNRKLLRYQVFSTVVH